MSLLAIDAPPAAPVAATANPVRPAGGTRTVPARRLPVGARFPRWSHDEPASVDLAPAPARRPAFPIGARFPRRSAAEVDALLELLACAAPATPRVGRLPIGARFPRRLGR